MYLKAKTTRSASPTPPQARQGRVQVKKKPRPSIAPTQLPPPPSRLISSHISPLQRHKNNARLTIPLPTATTPELPPPNPRVPAQDSLATLAPQRQHQWLCLFQQPHAATATQFHEQRELRRVNTTKTTERLYFQRARASALLETRHQARAGCQSGCAHREAQGNVSEEGAGGEGGSAV
jgi:hypothetical protein